VTLGERGCFVSLPDRGEHVPAHKVTVVDSTGAGDAFVGAFAAALLQTDRDLLAATEFATAAAARSVTVAGTSSSMPTRWEIIRFLETASRRRALAKVRVNKKKR
jgi:ribokinase